MPPYTSVKSLDFEDYPFEIERWEHTCALCDSDESFLDEVIVDDAGARMYVCSDTDYCRQRVALKPTAARRQHDDEAIVPLAANRKPDQTLRRAMSPAPT